MDQALLGGKAYRIFFEEIRKHLAEFEKMKSSSASLSPEQLKIASMRFHTIKGGSGFFGLTEIAQLAAEMEKLTKDRRQPLSAAEEQALIGKFCELKSHVAKMVRPTFVDPASK